MIITFLNCNEFANVNGKEVYLHAGFGIGRNVMYMKKGNDGKIYAKLSPIANPVYSGVSQEIKSERVIKEIKRKLEI